MQCSWASWPELSTGHESIRHGYVNMATIVAFFEGSSWRGRLPEESCWGGGSEAIVRQYRRVPPVERQV